MSQSSPDLPIEPEPQPTRPSATGATPVWTTVITGLVCLGIGLSVSLISARRKEPPPVASTSTLPSVEPKKPAPTQLELTEQGNPQAIDALEKTAPSERTIDQALALSQGRYAEKHLALTHLRSTIAKAGGTPDTESIKRLIQFAKDPDTSREVIGLFATLPGPAGPDLLNEFATDKKTGPELAKLAEELLRNKEVRPKASPALALVLDLREATTCEARESLLEKAAEIGDRRVLGLAVTLVKKTGCGDNGRKDCNPCLRADNSKILSKAIGKVQTRKAPSY
jgi:hypothetical protein